MPNPDVIPAAGDVLADKYRIERVLGRGGMGIVLAALHIQLEERVAIKFLLPELAHDAALVARFLREARAAIKIRSEHVVRVLDVGSLPGGTPYMVMEHLQGKNFEELLEDQGCLPTELAVDHILQATEALAEVHALGMIHRDLKPANLFLAHRVDGSPCVKVLDFGITKLIDTGANPADPAAFDSTNANVVMGSPRYMSPEQMRSTKTLDARTDIWALGVILHELIAGASPFDGETMPDLLAAILQDPTPLLRKTRPDVAPGLEAVVARCLEKEPAGRFADVADLTQALAPFGSPLAKVSADRVSRVLRPRSPSDSRTSAPVVRTAIPAMPSDPAASGSVTVSATSGWNASPPPPRRSAWQIAAVVGGVAFVTTMSFAIFGSHGPSSAAAAPPSAEAPAALAPAASINGDTPFPPIELVPPAPPTSVQAAPSASGAFAVARAPATPPAVISPSMPRRHAAAAGPSTPEPKQEGPAARAPASQSAEPDLFEGRK